MIVVNLFGGPGTGKSTIAALTFGKLKTASLNCELVTEFAKELVWEKRSTIACQPYVFGKQLWRLERLRGQVDAAVTDSPILLSAYYGAKMGRAWEEVVVDAHESFDRMDIFLARNNEVHPYQAVGRYQSTVAEAEVVDRGVLKLLEDWGIDFRIIKVDSCDLAAELIAASVIERLEIQGGG